MRLGGKTALIAGASRNIGRTIALTFAREVANVVAAARQMNDELRQVARDCEAYGVKALAVAADVGDHEQVDRAVRLALEGFGNVEVLVSVAAVRPHKPFWEIGYEEWHQVLAVNLHSTFCLAKALAPGLIDTERRNPEWYPEGGGVPHGAVSSKSDGTPLGREEGTPLNRKGTPQEVANAAPFLASDESSFIPGDRMICAGGRYM